MTNRTVAGVEQLGGEAWRREGDPRAAMVEAAAAAQVAVPVTVLDPALIHQARPTPGHRWSALPSIGEAELRLHALHHPAWQGTSGQPRRDFARRVFFTREARAATREDQPETTTIRVMLNLLAS